MTPEAQKIRSDAITAAIDYGYTPLDAGAPTDLRAPPGKFEGEPYYALYFHNTALDGFAEPLYHGDTVAADICEISDAEREAFELSADTQFIALWYSDAGFVTLDGLTAAQYNVLLDKYNREDDK